MDPKERLRNLSQLLTNAMQGWQADLWSAMPGIIQSVDYEQQSCVVQLSVQVSVRDITTGQDQIVSISPLLDCPLYFPHGGQCSITFPVAAGDECLVVFASRCIDGWFQNGGIQPQGLFRMHDLSDGFVFAGFRSVPNVVSGISATKLQVRSADGNNVIELDPLGGQVNLKANTSIKITAPLITLDGPVVANNTMAVDSTLDAMTTLIVNGRDFTSHIHSGVSTGTHDTGPPV